ncbi:Putative ribonuclease H protein At1g65750 [Linum perenne]
MSPPQANRGADDWVWGLERSGEFSIKTAYNLICQSNALPSSDIWKVVWRWEGPNRIKHFIWLAANDKLLTNVVRRRRGFCSDDTCRGCGTEAESILHILRDCAFAKETWRAVGGFNTDGAEWQFSLTEWLQLFLAGENGLRFGIVCWYLWRARNERASDWIIVNSDGSVLGSRGRAAAGGLLRDSTGRCIDAYAMNLGVCSITRAEIRGALEGISRAWAQGHKKVEVQLDSTAAIAILLDTDSKIEHNHALEVFEFRDWIRKDWELRLKHVYREANQAADFLANFGHGLQRGCHSVAISDCNLAYHIRYDALGISEPRLVN